MKRVIIAAVASALVLVLIAAALVFINKLILIPAGNAEYENFTYTTDEIKNIGIDVSVAYVSIYKSSGVTVDVEFVESGKGLYTASAENGVLSITETGSSSWLDKLIRSDNDRYGVSIGIPDGHTVGLNINADTSTVTVDGISISGDADIKVMTGDITVRGVDAEGIITTDVITGNVTLDTVASKSVSADITTGDITVRKVSAEESITLSSTTGMIMGSLPGPRDSYSITASVMTGVCDLKSGGSGDIRLTANVTTGSIAIEFE